jgi:hypothetical protein
MTDEEIFDLAETHGWQDDFGRWNFKDDGLIKFALEIKTAEWVGLTDDEIWEAFHKYDTLQYMNFARSIEAKLKEKNS